jgi:hypothetical protein
MEAPLLLARRRVERQSNARKSGTHTGRRDPTGAEMLHPLSPCALVVGLGGALAVPVGGGVTVGGAVALGSGVWLASGVGVRVTVALGSRVWVRVGCGLTVGLGVGGRLGVGVDVGAGGAVWVGVATALAMMGSPTTSTGGHSGSWSLSHST